MRRLLAAGGILAMLLGVVTSGTGAGGPVSSVVQTLGNDYFLLVAVGGVAAAGAMLATASGSAETMNQVSTPDPEGPVTVPAAGDRLDQRLSTWQLRLPLFGAESREAVRDRLRSAAVGTVRRTDSCSRTDAAEQVAAGEWTDDERAAAFVADGHLTLGATVRAPRYARHTVDAIEALDAGDATGGGET
ncbi:DUF7269 family protein [Haloarchaeobius baliensis]|uniref:DUF7269 family protein n=1 Tax=Haloarchaeobius baliensis TaxID=1670458 RepID=UPI003F8809B6